MCERVRTGEGASACVEYVCARARVQECCTHVCQPTHVSVYAHEECVCTCARVQKCVQVRMRARVCEHMRVCECVHEERVCACTCVSACARAQGRQSPLRTSRARGRLPFRFAGLERADLAAPTLCRARRGLSSCPSDPLHNDFTPTGVPLFGRSEVAERAWWAGQVAGGWGRRPGNSGTCAGRTSVIASGARGVPGHHPLESVTGPA